LAEVPNSIRLRHGAWGASLLYSSCSRPVDRRRECKVWQWVRVSAWHLLRASCMRERIFLVTSMSAECGRQRHEHCGQVGVTQPWCARCASPRIPAGLGGPGSGAEWRDASQRCASWWLRTRARCPWSCWQLQVGAASCRRHPARHRWERSGAGGLTLTQP
jgi:hypothetical protein